MKKYLPNIGLSKPGTSLFYEGIKLTAIYKVAPPSLESKFQYWEEAYAGMKSINNPKIPLSLVRKKVNSYTQNYKNKWHKVYL